MTPAASTVLVFLDPAFPDGRVADATRPQLMVTDLGATRGDGVFETMLAVDGAVRKMQAHLDRLATSAEARADNGAYWSVMEREEPSAVATPELAAELWVRSEEWVAPFRAAGPPG